MISRSSSILASTALVLLAATAGAQGNTAIAEGLFREGTKLLVEKKFAEACPKLQESARMDPSSGVELALGICYEGLGKTASAWAAYENAVTLARRDNRHDREHAAVKKANAIEPKLAHATLEVPASVASLAGLQVKEDDVVLGSAAWSNAPIDPGSHKLEVTATGKKPWSTSFTIDGAATSKTITVPELEAEPVAVRSETEQPLVNEQRGSGTFRVVAIVSVSAGAVSIVAASILGGIAIADASDVHKTCPGSVCADSRAVSENNTAGSLADWSTALFVVSGLCFATGVVFFLVRPPRSHAMTAVLPVIGPGVFGLRGTF
jgi:hypothetical protein